MTAYHINKSTVTQVEDDRSKEVFFNTLYDIFQRSEKSAGALYENYFAISGYSIRLRFAGPSLVPYFTPALKHLCSEPVRSPSLSVCLIDSLSAQENIPPAPWTKDDYVTRGEIRGYNNERFSTAYNLDAGMLSMLDKWKNLAIFWVKDVSRIPDYEKAAPLRTIFHWWMRENERLLLHAAAVGTSGGGVLLAGKGGTGKSTAALACLYSELFYIGDDYVLLRRKPLPFVYNLYNTAKLEAEHMKKFPRLIPMVSNHEAVGKEKAILFLNHYFKETDVTCFPVQAILIPRIIRTPVTRLHKASHAACVKALAPSTIFQLPGGGRKEFDIISEFVKSVPGFILELGSDLSQIPEVILDLLLRNKA